MTTPLVTILYDGITNSVFEGQVLAPMLAKKKQNPDRLLYLVSFEKKLLSAQACKRLVPEHMISFVQYKRLPFLGIATLYPALYQLKRFLQTLDRYELVARGPMAGWLALGAAQPERCTSLTIQARGLLAQEYAYAHASRTQGAWRLWHTCRSRQLAYLEKTIYSARTVGLTIHYQAVSSALKEYLHQEWGTPLPCISIAHEDIPQPHCAERIRLWRTQVRTELGISQQTHVYCYNGSLKAWQSPQKVINFFDQKLKVKPEVFLLVLTQDVEAFNTLVTQAGIDRRLYHVRYVPHDQIYQFLAAADSGIIFREPHIINWVSRPTKALEYQAVGLDIIHNNTVAWLNTNAHTYNQETYEK